MANKTIKKTSRKSMKKRGGSKPKSLKRKTSKKGLRRLNQDVSEVLECDNQRFGCDIKPHDQLKCYKRMKMNKHTTRPDSIYLTNKKVKGTKKLSKGLLKFGGEWYDCSDFPN